MSRLGALGGVVVLGGSLLLGTGSASAQEAAPGAVPSCADYVTQPDAQAAFVIDRVRLAALDPDRDGIACTDLPDLLPARALAAVGEGGQDGETGQDSDSSGRTASDSTTSDGSTASTTATSAGVADSYQDLLDGVAALECGPTFNAEAGALNDRFLALIPTLSQEEQGAYDDALTARDAALNYCDATTATVTSTADDGSVPITSGGQVSVVPEGSAETGEA